MRIKTTRCIIRALSLADAEDLFAVLSDEVVMRYIETPFTLSQTEDFIRKAGLCQPPLVYAVVWKETAQVIGHVIFHPYDADCWEIGWILGKGFWCMGIASELTEALIHQAKAMGVSGCVIECHPAQEATARMASKYSFVYEGLSDGCHIYRLTF